MPNEKHAKSTEPRKKKKNAKTSHIAYKLNNEIGRNLFNLNIKLTTNILEQFKIESK